MGMKREARQWLKDIQFEVPERMPNVDQLYEAGATWVSIEDYNSVSGRTVLGIMFPSNAFKITKLWLRIANCDHDGVKLNENAMYVKMLILGPEEHIDKVALGPNSKGGSIEW